MTRESQAERPQLAPGVRYRWDEMREQHQLLFPEGLLVLNESGAAIVRLCDGRTTDQMIHELEDLVTDGNESRCHSRQNLLDHH